MQLISTTENTSLQSTLHASMVNAIVIPSVMANITSDHQAAYDSKNDSSCNLAGV